MLDAFVPSWFAVNPASRQGAVLKSLSCTWESDPVFNHFCIMTAAATEVAEFVRTGNYPARTHIRTSIAVSIEGTNSGSPLDGTVVARRQGAIVAGQRPATAGPR